MTLVIHEIVILQVSLISGRSLVSTRKFSARLCGDGPGYEAIDMRKRSRYKIINTEKNNGQLSQH